MPTIFRVGSFAIVVFPADHDPPHVHAIGNGRAKIEIGRSRSDVVVVTQSGLTRAEVRDIKDEIKRRYFECLEAWRKRNGN